MEPKPWEVAKYLANPDPAHRIFLLFGPDSGLVSERSEALVRRFLGEDFDPLQLARLTAEMLAEDPARLFDESRQIGLFGDARVIRVADAGVANVARGAEALFENDTPPPNAVILEAGELKPGAKIRRLAAQSGHAAALACYPDDERELDRMAGEMLGAAGLKADRDARAEITRRLGPDRQSNRRMLETLILYKLEDDAPVTPADVAAVMGDQSAIGFDAVAFAAFEGQTAEALALFDKSIAEKTDPEMVMASLLRQLDRFDLVRGFVEAGRGMEIGIKAARVGPRERQAALRRQLNRWPTSRTAAARRLVLETQIEMRGVHSPISPLLCRRLLLRLAASRPRN